MPSNPELIFRYFPQLNSTQKAQIEALGPLYLDWNSKINVISRKDIEELYTHHVLHALGIAKVMPFSPMTQVLDVGTGGGFPGIPLAILFPETEFTLCDSIGKKIKVVNEVAKELGLKNVQGIHERVEKLPNQYDFVISRAVTRLAEIWSWIGNKYLPHSFNPLDNGMLYLKGGDLNDEIKELKRSAKIYPLSDFFEEEFFETKAVVYVPAKGKR
jgi:16S rRNA (guanine527-N7)-methyltransferase